MPTNLEAEGLGLVNLADSRVTNSYISSALLSIEINFSCTLNYAIKISYHTGPIGPLKFSACRIKSVAVADVVQKKAYLKRARQYFIGEGST